ncbi:MAG TPA: winged helix DNA-binding domain-containing protein, partial [Actinomycetota bacterium]|nr:winged helix DNA-binding domain-containing protein [Actinomycetota bacterium]
LAPGSIRSNARRSAEMGLDEPAYRQALDLMDAALSGGRSLSRLGLKEALERRGVDASGQRMVYLLARASAEGLVCEGPLQGRFPTYVRVADWLDLKEPQSVDRSEDLARLVDRYLDAYGPAGPEDLAAWSGISLTECRQAFAAASGLTKLVVDGRTVWITGHLERAEPPLLVLLPAFDTFLLGYRDRSLHLDKVHTKRVNAGGGMIKPVLLAGGRVAGTWSMKRGAGRLRVAVDPFSALPASLSPALETEVADLGRFLEVTPELDLRRAGPA